MFEPAIRPRFLEGRAGRDIAAHWRKVHPA
jgi:hypothetical protein